ncbi:MULTISPECIES: GNAT family N-acetyltransferase [Pseudoxanthomonas]|uniref:GNAT family N-acetyltransferase n=1 Tax=Pseudoxanthomonas TaxID=83618 RepID=UPI00161C9C03|nr:MULTISPECIES: GNAT family N-acetyltransferase [Pseudoxanthomonas]MBB3274485.1 phosphinothricin acetyltransferase [Pseudoxanthomonas sp. OG2]MBD9378159.1 N-acetyltransferase family protein [Pseudoxanthomonas sp. PXM04]MBV7474991.1 GNAT family N-acetyltransferase [Pseudoxanthomonas sp. PXM05]UBB27082.1 GNAT family N-acetyltransferase [Pseudoxanthomonas japonensis]
MPLHIRDATEADIPAIAALYAEEVRERVATYEYDVPDEAEMAQRMRAVQAAGYPYFVAERDGRFAGYAYASSYRSRIGYRWTVEDTVYIVPEHQGQGVGKALLQRLIDACEASGFRQMIAVIGEPANGASVALHEKLGFRTVGVFQGLGRKHGRWLDTVQMQRALGAGDGAAPSDE